jgi:hypothetical protein
MDFELESLSQAATAIEEVVVDETDPSA